MSHLSSDLVYIRMWNKVLTINSSSKRTFLTSSGLFWFYCNTAKDSNSILHKVLVTIFCRITAVLVEKRTGTGSARHLVGLRKNSLSVNSQQDEIFSNRNEPPLNRLADTDSL